jgi:four helix bundle protein
MKDFRELVVWQRACVSIPANIAEGCGRGSDAGFARFLHIAMGSACELEYHLLLAQELDFLERTDFDRLSGKLAEIKKMLSALIKKLKADRSL